MNEVHSTKIKGKKGKMRAGLRDLTFWFCFCLTSHMTFKCKTKALNWKFRLCAFPNFIKYQNGSKELKYLQSRKLHYSVVQINSLVRQFLTQHHI